MKFFSFFLPSFCLLAVAAFFQESSVDAGRLIAVFLTFGSHFMKFAAVVGAR